MPRWPSWLGIALVRQRSRVQIPPEAPQHEPATDFEQEIIKTLWGMKKDHYAETTIAVIDRRLKLIAKTANLDTLNKSHNT